MSCFYKVVVLWNSIRMSTLHAFTQELIITSVVICRLALKNSTNQSIHHGNRIYVDQSCYRSIDGPKKGSC